MLGSGNAQDLGEPTDALGPESGLQQPPLPSPELALAGDEPFPEHRLQSVMERGAAVVPMIFLQHVTDMRGVGEHDDRVAAGHGKAHDVGQRPGPRENGKRVTRERR